MLALSYKHASGGAAVRAMRAARCSASLTLYAPKFRSTTRFCFIFEEGSVFYFKDCEKLVLLLKPKLPSRAHDRRDLHHNEGAAGDLVVIVLPRPSLYPPLVLAHLGCLLERPLLLELQP